LISGYQYRGGATDHCVQVIWADRVSGCRDGHIAKSSANRSGKNVDLRPSDVGGRPKKLAIQVALFDQIRIN
jgi:hypothetical protein